MDNGYKRLISLPFEGSYYMVWGYIKEPGALKAFPILFSAKYYYEHLDKKELIHYYLRLKNRKSIVI